MPKIKSVTECLPLLILPMVWILPSLIKDFLFPVCFMGQVNAIWSLGSITKDESVHVKNEYQLDYWREDNRDATFPRKSLSSSVNGGNNQEKSSFWVKNASFLRLKNLSLAYDFKYKLLKNANWLSMCKSECNRGQPIHNIGSFRLFRSGNDFYERGYPVQRVYSVGVTVGF